MNLNGPGKYDNECASVIESTQAAMALVIVIGGNKGHGFSVKAESSIGETLIKNIPATLRRIADDIEAFNEKAPDKDKQENRNN